MVCNSSFAVERSSFVVCLELAFKNSPTPIFHRVLPWLFPHSHLPHAGRQSSREIVPVFFSDATPIPAMLSITTPSSPAWYSNCSNCSGKIAAKKPWQAKAATIYSKSMVRDNSLSRAKSRKSEGKVKEGWPGKPQEALFPWSSGALWRKKATAGHG